jgi:hypothetical protein
MIKPLALIALLFFTNYSASAQPSRDTQLLNGHCGPESHTAEGALGSDLRLRQSKFFCDAAIITHFHDRHGHLMIQFSERRSHHSQMLGFAGTVDSDGIMMPVDHVFFSPGEPTNIKVGVCKFFFKNRIIDQIFCGISLDEEDRRTTAVITFVVDHR